MRLGNSDLSIFLSALLCFATFVITPSEAVPPRPWYLAAFDRVLRVVDQNDSQPDAAPQKEAAKQIEQAYLSRLTKAEEGTITLRGQVPSDSDLKSFKVSLRRRRLALRSSIKATSTRTSRIGMSGSPL